jgi:zinc protease
MKKITLYILFLFCAVGFIDAQVDRTKAPQPGPAPKIQIGDYTKFELPNGLKVFVVENHRIPRVSYSLTFVITPELEGASAGIGSITSDLIGTGTAKRTKDQINEEIDFIAADLDASAEGIYGSSLKKHTTRLLDVFSDVAMNSVFTKEELEKKRTQTLSGLASQKDDPSAIANNVSSAIIYGKNHPYGEFETEASVSSITLDMCNQYYKKYVKPNVAYLTVVGDITPAEARKLIEKYFNTWQKGQVPSKTYAAPAAPTKSRVIVVDRPASVQSVIDVCYPVELGMANPDFLKVKVANTVLGGGVFRLFMNLREKHAYTYGAYSSFKTLPLAASFGAEANVRNAVTDSAVYQILYEMKRIKDEQVPADELKMAKNYLSGNFALSLERPQTIASFAVNTERYKLPKDFYTNYLKNIEAVTSADVESVAKKYIYPEKANILVVGKASEIAEPLKKFSADGKIEYYDSNANPIDQDAKVKAIPAGVTAKQVFEKYIAAAGGKENILKVKDVSMSGTFNIQGMTLPIKVLYKIPGKYLVEVSMNGQVVQKEVYNNGVGKSSGMQGNKVAEGAELEKMKMDAEVFPELKYAEFGYKTELKEMADVNGNAAYVIEVTSPSGKTSRDFYAVETGLKVKTESIEETPGGSVAQIAEIVEYTDVQGVKYPKVIKQTAGPQSFEIKIGTIEVNKGIEDEVFN